MDAKRKLIKFAIVMAAVTIVFSLADGMEPKMRLTLALLVMASSLWITEAIPLAATSLLVAFSQPVLGIQGFTPALSHFFDPVVALLLGGFLLARTVEKYDLDEFFAHKIVKRFGVDSKMVVLGLMLATAFLSMWISNTASTALMITLALRLTANIKDKHDNLAKIMVLGIAYSATAGGLSTLIGSTPNVIAAAFLKDTLDYDLTFLGWSLYGVPISLLSILVIWLLLFKIFPTKVKGIPLPEQQEKALNNKQKLTLAIFAVAIVLWFSGQLPEPLAGLLGWRGHGLTSSMVAIFVAIVLFLTNLLEENDFSRISWGTLLLIGGGLSLGSALEVSGLTIWIGEIITNVSGVGSAVALVLILGFSALGFSIIASNTASASIFIPIAISAGIASDVNPVVLAVLVAICSSLDYMLPVGTPPNAIAYSTGKVKMREMVKAGFMLDILGCLLAILLALTVWNLLV
ncbi:MAG: SLC13 family permease [Candidatus Bathyarchaeia archaeon]